VNTPGPSASGWTSHRRAILVMCAGVLLLVMNDAMTKTLVARYEPLQIIFVRSMLALPVVVAIVLVRGGRQAFRSARLRVHALRGLLGIGAAQAFIGSLATLPLAEATTLAFAAPLFVAALSVPLLGERVGWRRATAVVIGFLGVLVIVRPGAATFQAGSLMALSAALIYGLLLMTARWIHRGDSLWTMMFYMTVFSGVYTSWVVFRDWPVPQPSDALLFLGVTVLGTIGLVMISQAFRSAPAALVAPFEYTALLWASLLGWLIWGVVPDAWTYVGAAVIVAGGLYVILSEARGTRDTNPDGAPASRA